MTLCKGNEITYGLPRNYLCSMTCKALSHKGLQSKRHKGLPRLPFPDAGPEQMRAEGVLRSACTTGLAIDVDGGELAVRQIYAKKDKTQAQAWVLGDVLVPLTGIEP